MTHCMWSLLSARDTELLSLVNRLLIDVGNNNNNNNNNNNSIDATAAAHLLRFVHTIAVDCGGEGLKMIREAGLIKR